MTESATTALGDLLDAFASSDPLPGGGSAAALTGSVGVSLLLMVAGMDKTRTGAPEEAADLAAAAARLRPLRDELITMIDEDSTSYLAVLAAYRQPRTTDEEKTARRDAVALAMRNATEAPLQTMRACDQALREAVAVVRFGNRNAVTDAAVGARLLRAALESAALNVAGNLPGVKDTAYVSAAEEERRALLTSAATFAKEVDDAMP